MSEQGEPIVDEIENAAPAGEETGVFPHRSRPSFRYPPKVTAELTATTPLTGGFFAATGQGGGIR